MDVEATAECECRERLLYGSRAKKDCPWCKGSGYVKPDSGHVKDWSKEPPRDEDW